MYLIMYQLYQPFTKLLRKIENCIRDQPYITSAKGLPKVAILADVLLVRPNESNQPVPTYSEFGNWGPDPTQP